MAGRALRAVAALDAGHAPALARQLITLEINYSEAKHKDFITKYILIQDTSDQDLVGVAPEGVAGAGKALPGPLSKRVAVEAPLAAVARRARVSLPALYGHPIMMSTNLF